MPGQRRAGLRCLLAHCTAEATASRRSSGDLNATLGTARRGEPGTIDEDWTRDARRPKWIRRIAGADFHAFEGTMKARS